MPLQADLVFPDLGCGLGKDVMIGIFPILDLAFRLVLRDAIVFLDFAHQVFPFAGDLVQMVVGKRTPLRFDAALELLPVPFNAIPIHVDFLPVHWLRRLAPVLVSRGRPVLQTIVALDQCLFCALPNLMRA